MLITMIKTQDKSHVMYSKTEIGQNFSIPTIAKVILGLIILDFKRIFSNIKKIAQWQKKISFNL